jgi:hypothetical protein
MADVMKVLEDLKYKSVGVDPDTKQMPEGFFVSFRPIGLPIPEEDFKNPWTPTGSNLKEILDSKPKAGTTSSTGVDPATVPAKSASQQMEDNQYLSANIGASMQAYLQTFMLTDSKITLDLNFRAMPQCGKVNDAWFAIINGANGIPSDMELNDEMKKAIADATAVLMDKDGNPTPHYDAYLRQEDDYRSKVKARNHEYANAASDPMKLQMWPMNGKLFQDEIDEAFAKWQGFGFKVEIDKAMDTLAAQGIDPAIVLIARAKNKYENSLVNIPLVGNIPYTFMSPSRWYDPFGDGWNNYSQNDFHSETHFSSETTKSSGGGGFSIGFFSIGGSASTSETKTELNINTEGLTVEFEYTVVDIIRPWLDTTLLNLSNWFVVGDYPASCISTGKFQQEFKVNDPNMMLFMPSIVTSMVLARNVNIQWAKTDEHRDTLDSAVSGGGMLGFGPFFCGGSHSETKHKTNTSLDQHSQGLRIDGVQLIGYVSTIMPSSPKKNGKDFMKKIEPKTTPAIGATPVPAANTVPGAIPVVATTLANGATPVVPPAL